MSSFWQIRDSDPGAQSVNGFVAITGCLFTLRFIAMFQEDRRKRSGNRERKGLIGERMEVVVGRTKPRRRRRRRRSGVEWCGEEGISQTEGERYEYSNFTLLIRDGLPLPLGRKALLVFVSSLIICMMYSTALYSVMGGGGDDILAGWQWGLRCSEAGTVSFIQCKDQRPCFFTQN